MTLPYIQIRQTVGNIANPGTTVSATLVGAPQPNSQLLVAGFTDALNVNISMSALTGQTWTKVVGVNGSSSQHDLFAYISQNPGTGTTVTMNNGSSVSCAIVVIEIGYVPKLTTDDGHSNALVSTSSVTTWTCPSVTPTTSGDICVTWYADLNSGAITNPTGFTVDTNGTQSVAGERLIVARKFKTDASAESPVWTNGTAIMAGFAAQLLLSPAPVDLLTPQAQFIYMRQH